MPTTGVEQAKSSVLSTLNPDGSRKWLRPRPSRGHFYRWRRAVAYLLIALFTLIPYINLNGRPLILIDLPERQFSLFGSVFFPTDTVLLALAVVSFFVGIFLSTALSGRVWCGWACPQTVYMEFLVRPIERLFDGEPGRKTRTGAWRRPAKYLAYFIACFFLAHTFLSYFVGVDKLRTWIIHSPAEHPVGFFVVMFTTGLMMFDFCFFREQTCLVACPYGRFQSVLLDRNSLIVSYDPTRGEPRGKQKRARKAAEGGDDVPLTVLADGAKQGDCIDCRKCVTTCPTGIDIRNGLQMECVHCTQCIDACDDVMDMIGKPRGLIRYSSQAAIEGGKRQLIRPRVIIYPLILAIMLTGLVVVLATKDLAEITVIRARGGLPFFPVHAEQGELIGTRVKVSVRNRTPETVGYSIGLVGVGGGSINQAEGPMQIEPYGLETSEIVILVPPAEYGSVGRREVTLRVEGSDGFSKDVTYGLLGPAWTGKPAED
ncbi:MAG: cytochrome c oxidase accessory protein CcoG [Phycisphaerales bacterium]|nr:cytochrome c oxidase accessory protein CcoG [Phycisphaerales bacterium]